MAETKTDQKPEAQQPSPEVQRKPTPAELLALREALQKGRLAQNTNSVEEVLEERIKGQTQEQHVHSSTLAGWAAVVTVVAHTTTLDKDHEHRKAMERIREEMFELLAKEDKKRKMKDSPFFQQVATILGHAPTDSVTQTLESASGSRLQGNKESLAQAAKEIAATLERSAPHLKLSLSGEALSKAIEAEMVRAMAIVPKQPPALTLVRPEDPLATQAHEKILSLKDGEERLLQLQKMRGELGAERFSELVDAYDRKYGVPLAARVATTSTGSTTHQQEMIHVMRSLLTPEQQRRLADFGRAELSQSLALVQQQREGAERNQKTLTQELESVSRHLANSVIGKPELSSTPADQLRAKLLEELGVTFPQLKGKTWEAASLRLKEVAGQTDDKISERIIKKLCGNAGSIDLAEAKERIIRAASLTQRITDVEQKIASLKAILAQSESPDEKTLKEHYAAVYGKEILGGTSPEEQTRLTNLTRSANAYFQNLNGRIKDPELNSTQRQALIQERDAIEFTHVRRLVAASLEGSNPEPGRAILLLNQFATREIASEDRRSAPYIEAAKALVDAIKEADNKRLEASEHKGTAAPSTSWFAHIVTTGLGSNASPTPLVTTHKEAQSSALAQRLETIVAGKGGAERSGGAQRHALNEVDAASTSAFTRPEHLTAIEKPLSAEVLKKLGAETSGQAVLKISQELKQGQVPVEDKVVIASLRSKVDPSSPIGKILALVAPSPADTIREIQEIRSKLTPEQADEFESLFEKEKLLQHAEARIARVERSLAALSDAEHEEFLAFFEASTRRSLGQALIQDSMIGITDSTVLVSLANARAVSNRDLARFYDDAVPSDRAQRAQVMAAQIAADAARPPVDRKGVEETAKSLQAQMRSLEIAAMSAAATQRLDLLKEITDKMRSLEAQTNGKIAQSLASQPPSVAARQGTSALLRAIAEIGTREPSTEVDARIGVITALARDLEPLLRDKNPMTEAAFNRIRQANLTQEETLLLKAAYAVEASNPSALPSTRTITGDLAKDLAPLNAKYSFERARVDRLMVGGRDALVEADLETLKIAAAVKDEKTQLETLANLRALGEYEKFKERISAAPLAPSAAKYHQAVVAGDKVQADMTDLKIKAGNRDLKTTEVASFLADKVAEDYRRMQAADPQFTKAIQGTNPAFFDNTVSKLFSDSAAERKKGLEQAMLKSLSDPELFAQWLRVPQTKEARVEALRSLEALVEKQPTAPKFVTSGDPLKDELKIVQYIRAQKTDYREIDALLIKNLIVTALTRDGALDELTIRQIREIRIQAAAQLREIDNFIQPRRAVIESARSVLKMYEGSQVWAEGDSVLQQLQYGALGGLFQSRSEVDAISQQRAERIAYLQNTHPELARLTESKLEKGERGSRVRWTSGYLLDEHIELTRSRIADQRALLAPMERGLTDLLQTRELMRATFGLMAKDASNKVFQGLTPEVTQSAMVLLKQRQAKITYKVTNEKEHEKWLKSASETQSALSDRDFYTSVGLTVVKAAVVLTVAVIAPWGSPILVPFLVACAFNVGDKVFRGLVNNESWATLFGDGMVELGIDTLFLAFSWVKLSAVVRPGKAAIDAGVKSVKVAGRVSTPSWIVHQTKEGIKRTFNAVFKSGEPAKKATNFVFHKEWLPPPRWWGGPKNIFPELPKKFASLLQEGIKKFFVDGGKVVAKNAPGHALNWSEVSIKKSGRLLAGRWSSTPVKSVPTPVPYTTRIDDGAMKKKAPVMDNWGNQPQKILTPPVDFPHQAKAPEVPAPAAALDPLAGMARFVVRDTPPPSPSPTPPAGPTTAPADNGTKQGSPNGETASASSQPPPPAPPSTPPSAPPPPSGGTGGAPADPPAGDPSGRALQNPPAVAHAPQSAGDDGDSNKGKGPVAGAPGPTGQQSVAADPGFVPPAFAQNNPQPNQSPNGTATGVGNGSGNAASNDTGNGVSIAFADENRRSHGTASDIANRAASGVASPVILDIEIAAAASNRSSVQAALMHNAVATSSAATQGQKPESNAVGYSLQPVESFVAVADKNIKRDGMATAQLQLNEESLTLGLADQARREAAARVKDTIAATEIDKVVLKVEAPRLKDSLSTTEQIEHTEATTSASRQGEVATHVAPQSASERAPESVPTERPQGVTEREVALVYINSQQREPERIEIRTERINTRGSQTDSPYEDQRGSESRVAIQEKPLDQRTHTQSDDDHRVAQVTAQPSITTQPDITGQPGITAQPGAVALTAMIDAHAAHHSAAPQQPDSEKALVSLREHIVGETTPTIFTPQPIAPTLSSQGGSESQGSDGDSGGSVAPKKKPLRADKAQAARKRELIMQQLMAQHLSKMQREKLLKVLIELGISEQEYRSLVAKLGEMEVSRLAQQQANRQKYAEPIAVAQEVPAMKPPTKASQASESTDTKGTKPAANASPQTTRAEIYKRLREEASTKRKSA